MENIHRELPRQLLIEMGMECLTVVALTQAGVTVVGEFEERQQRINDFVQSSVAAAQHSANAQ